MNKNKRLVIWLIILLTSSFLYPLSSSYATINCKKMYLIVGPGTWESTIDPYRSLPKGLLDPLLAKLPKDKIKIVKIRYPATAFPWEAGVYGKSKSEGVVNTEFLLGKEIIKCPQTKLALLGFSQGADVLGDVAADIGNGRSIIPPNRIAAVALFADPRRSKHDHLIGPAVIGEGVGGPRPLGFGKLAKRVITICAVGDIVCAIPKEKYWSRIVGLLGEASNLKPQEIAANLQEANRIIDTINRKIGWIKFLLDLQTDPIGRETKYYEKFFKSKAHTRYPNYYINGVKAFDWVAQYLISKI